MVYILATVRYDDGEDMVNGGRGREGVGTVELDQNQLVN